MEQNAPDKFRLRLNLFDTVVLVVALIIAAAMAFVYFQGDEPITLSTSETKMVTYTIRLRSALPETADYIQVGDQLEDAVKNLDLGTVVSFSVSPSIEMVLDEENVTYIAQEHPFYCNIDLVVEAPATVSQDMITLTSGYMIRGGTTTYVRGPGYLGSGPLYNIDRGILE